jgi:hypothetical protein
MTTPPDEIGRAIAKWLAPYLAAELGTLPSAATKPGAEYDSATCAEYVRELGQGVLNRSQDFFMKLEHDGRIGSLDLALAIGTDTPRNIPANLTNSLKQRARRMGLAVPWDETESDDGRTVWLDRDGIASRMVEALRGEQHRRSGPIT